MTFAWPPLRREEPARQRVDLLVDEWANLPEDEPGELVDGGLVEEEVPDGVHELAVSWLIFVLRSWLGSRGFVFGSDLKVLTKPNTGRKPDLSVYLPGSSIPPRRGVVKVPPDIAVEVVTPSPRDERRDRVEKMAEYAQWGVPFYWLVDPALGTFEIFERDAAGRYVKLVGETAGRINGVPGCDGLSIDLDALWAELGRLSDDNG
jgi:Uma2 family endonuclease